VASLSFDLAASNCALRLGVLIRGNRVEIVSYENIQSAAPNILRGMGLTHLTKNENAKKELTEKGMAA
jgi:hypothetical protein